MRQFQICIQNVPDYDIEHSETMLYHIRILEDLGETSEALNILDINAKSRAIVDRTAIMEIRGKFDTRVLYLTLWHDLIL